MAISVGSPAPDFTLRTMTESGLGDVTLSDLWKSGPLVILFFPGAFTSVCEAELCDVTQGLSAYQSLGALVVGISNDSPFAMSAWAARAGIKIPLLTDWDHAVAAAYDVTVPNFAGLGKGTARAVFVVDSAGVVAYSEQTANLGDMPNFDALQAALRSMTKSN